MNGEREVPQAERFESYTWPFLRETLRRDTIRPGGLADALERRREIPLWVKEVTSVRDRLKALEPGRAADIDAAFSVPLDDLARALRFLNATIRVYRAGLARDLIAEEERTREEARVHRSILRKAALTSAGWGWTIREQAAEAEVLGFPAAVAKLTAEAQRYEQRAAQQMAEARAVALPPLPDAKAARTRRPQ